MRPFTFKDSAGNCYLYSCSKKRLLYICELLFELLNEYLNSGNIKENNKQYKSKSWDKALYKFNYYKEHGYFENIEIDLETQIESSSLENSLRNVRQVCFEVTQKCNLACVYCCYGDMYEHEGNDNHTEMSLQTALCFIDSLFNDQIRNMSSNKKITIGFYGGEPLLNFDLINKIVDYIQLKNNNQILQIQYIMTTNAILLERYIDFFVDHNFSIMVSMDGNYENSGFRINKEHKNLFDKIFNNLSLIKKKYPEYFKTNITFNSVIHSKNSIQEIVPFFKKEFDKIPQFSEVAPSFIRQEKANLFKKIYKPASLNYNDLKPYISTREYLQLDTYIKNIPIFFHRLLGLNIKKWGDLLYNYSNEKYAPSMCLPFSNKVFISANGNLHLCEHIGYNYSIGHIDIDNWKVVIDSKYLAQKYNEYFSMLKCSFCAEIITCDTCIFQKHMDCRPINEKEFAKKVAMNIECLRQRNYYLK